MSNSETEISVEQLKTRMDRGEDIFVLDVREKDESAISSIGGYLIPLATLPKRINELDPTREVVVYCRSGARSARAADFLRRNGFKDVKNLIGGINAWAEKIDPSLPRY